MSNPTQNLGLDEIYVDASVNGNLQKIDANVVNKNGTVPFVAEQIGVDPVNPQGLVTKHYLEDLISKISFPTADTSNMPTMANNAITPNTQIDFSSGVCYDLTTHNKITNTAMTKKLDATFVEGTGNGGLDTGSKANSTWYHCFTISKVDGTSDFLFSTSVTSPTMPSGFVNKRRVGSIKTNESGNIIAFVQNNDCFLYITPIIDLSSSTLPTSNATSYTLSIPPAIRTIALLDLFALSSGVTYFYIRVFNPDCNDVPLGTNTTLGNFGVSTTGVTPVAGSTRVEVLSNTNSQISARAHGAVSLTINTVGYIDSRGVN